MQLRPYQEKSVDALRVSYRSHRHVFFQLITGGGKTVIVSSITKSLMDRGNRVWFIVPRNELLTQASEHFHKWKIPHGIISAKSNESRAYKIHVISKDTLIRRMKAGKIKNWPDFVIFDEAHVAIDQQATIIKALPETSRALGISATPERTDGRGLSDIYDDIVYGPEMAELIEMGYIAPFRYFAPPIDGLDSLHRRGTDYDATELDDLLKKRAVYGKAIEHYRKLADGQPCIVFCRNIKAAEDTATRFREAGYNFESIDGRMGDRQRKEILDGVRSGKLHGITSVELVTYGLDVPRVSCIIMLRPTMSKAIFFQQVGRALRPKEGKVAIILDHVGNIREFGNPISPQEWNFYGKEKRKKKGVSADVMKQCKSCWLWYEGTGACPNCGSSRDNLSPTKQGLLEVDGRLVEAKGPITLKQRPVEERREFHDQVSAIKDRYLENPADKDVAELVELAESVGYSIMWVYHQLNHLAHAVNVPLLTAIQRVKGYKAQWVHFKRESLQRRGA